MCRLKRRPAATTDAKQARLDQRVLLRRNVRSWKKLKLGSSTWTVGRDQRTDLILFLVFLLSASTDSSNGGAALTLMVLDLS